MELKKHIAFILVVIFLGKMISIDAKLFGVLLDNTGISLVNKRCAKPKLTPASEVISTASFDQGLEMDFLCHSVFDQNLAEWTVAVIEDNFREYSYQSPGLFPTPRDKFYPPPKV